MESTLIPVVPDSDEVRSAELIDALELAEVFPARHAHKLRYPLLARAIGRIT